MNEKTFGLIKQAIENSINGTQEIIVPEKGIKDEYNSGSLYPESYVRNLIEQIEAYKLVHAEFEKIKNNKYTEREVMDRESKAFYAAQDKDFSCGVSGKMFKFKYPTFSDYKNDNK